MERSLADSESNHFLFESIKHGGVWFQCETDLSKRFGRTIAHFRDRVIYESQKEVKVVLLKGLSWQQQCNLADLSRFLVTLAPCFVLLCPCLRELINVAEPL